MTPLRIVLAILGLTLVGLIAWAISGQTFMSEGAWLVSHRWGIVSLADLYLGFILIGVLIWLFEPNKLIALVFILPLPFLGNIWSVIWVIWRVPGLIKAQKQPNPQ